LLQVASTAIAGPVNPWLWITHGFEGFYVPYPEWPGPANDFWRPLVNVLYWLRYQLSGEHLSSALLVGYLAHAAIVGIVCFVALRLFRLSPLATFGAVAIAALNPAYVYHSMLDPYHVPRGHDWHSVLLHGSELLINLAWWAALVAAIVVAYRAWGRRWLTQQPEPWLIGLVFALGNLVAVLLLPATELRYAYFWFALGPAAVFAAWSRRPAGIAVAATLSVALLVPQVSSLADSLSDASLASYRAARQSARQLTQLLAALPSTVHTVYLLDDLAVQSSSPEYFARFSGFHGRLVLINNITSI
jgi:hypothetical protein